ncbi:hypothetical protein MTR_7g093650 [Medicago truncatula]|uniref:Uncharacterized protein n=1 Tax=Medicago truncatula TaxID=3880 RepID=G7KWA8_MEDTR|nr:hypothetical protein MTR_7g093650 [Medicago truncatula]
MTIKLKVIMSIISGEQLNFKSARWSTHKLVEGSSNLDMKLRKNAIFIESATAESNGSKNETKKEGDAIFVEKQLMKQLKFCCC